MATGGGGEGGGTYGSPTSGDLPSAGGGSNDPLALTGMSRESLSSGTLGAGYQSVDPLPNDSIFIGAGALGRPVGTRGHDPGRSSGFTTYDQAQNLPAYWYSNDPSRYKSLVAKLVMYKVPGINPDSGLPEIGQAWDQLLSTAIRLNKSQGKDQKTNWTPWDILESYNQKPGSLGTHREGDFLIDNASGERVKYVGPRTKTSKQSAIDLSNHEQVQSIAEQALTQLIGRAPTVKELAQFKSTLNGYEREHPEVTTTTDHYDDMGNVVASDVVHAGGVDEATRAGLISSGVKKGKEYGKYQAGTTYFNALMQMVGGG